MELKYRETITVVVNGKKYEYVYDSEKKDRDKGKCNSPTSTFWNHFTEEFFTATGGDLQPLYRLIAYDTGGAVGGESTSLDVSTSSTSTKLTVRVFASIVWESTRELGRVVINSRHRTTGSEFAYFDATISPAVPASYLSVVEITYTVEIYVSSVSNTGAISGWETSMLGLFDHVGGKLNGSRTSKVYIHRARLTNQYGTQELLIPLELDASTRRAFRSNFVSPSRVDTVYWVYIQGTTPAGGTFNLISYNAPSLDRTFSIVENQVVNIEVKLNLPL